MSTEQAAISALALTEADVLRLLEGRSAEVLEDISKKIAGSYSVQQLNPQESQAAEQIFRLLLRETETRVRSGLAERLKASRVLPRDIVMTMAHDVAEVALPILEYSEVLTEADLIQLVEATADSGRHIAISKRREVGEKLSDTLLTKGSEQVAATLLENAGAEISESGLSRIVEKFPENKPLMSALVARPGLPPHVAERLVNHVSGQLAKTLKSKYNLPARDIEQEVEKTRESETLNIVRHTRDQGETDKLVAQLLGFGRLTPSLLMSSLCQGNLMFFETAMARMAGVSLANARALIGDRGDLGFRAIYNKSGLPEAMFSAVRILLRVVRELEAEGAKSGNPHYANRIVERILSYGEKQPAENLSYIIALVRKSAH
ncbi:MAG: DUF2336 domain-containing protein [Proteobacteria bacterium]|nr:DUF2336 domain-containing protein [Pseudomonadota bacterium]